MAVIEAELGAEAPSLFSDLTPRTKPIAAASLGQVYRLRLAETGELVAVKVQRPDMLLSVLLDVYIIRRLAQVVEKVKGLVTWQRPYDVALVDTFATASLQELDYKQEAANQVHARLHSCPIFFFRSCGLWIPSPRVFFLSQESFREDLMSRLKGKVYVPKVHRATRKVLVTEWIPGKKLADSEKEVIRRLTPVGVECFLIQLLETGNFHADPHPGNLLVTPDGQLALIDFGLCAKVPLPDTRYVEN